MNDLVILTALLGGPAYGYALKKTAGLIFGNGALHNNVIYPALKKFVKTGWGDRLGWRGARGRTRSRTRSPRAGRNTRSGKSEPWISTKRATRARSFFVWLFSP